MQMGHALNRQELLRQLSAEPKIVQAALAIIQQHVADSAHACSCSERAVMTAGGYAFADGGDVDECDTADDPQACRDSREFWSNVRHRVENGAMDWAEGKIRGALNIKPGAIAAMQGRVFPAGAALAEEGAGALGAAETGGAALEGLASLARFFPMLMI
jgi:hypothetical protein